MLKSLALMASMIEARDAYTGGHLWRVSRYCRHLAEVAGLPREWVNGTGYPSGHAEDEISIVARIVGIADAFDALTSTRPYRKGVAAFPAASELKKERGTQFDRKLLDLFFDWIEDDRAERIVGHSDDRVAMVHCPLCGPVITVSSDAQDGDTAYCRVYGSAHRLHRDGDTFVVEPMERECTAEELQPRPEIRPIDAFITEAPTSVVV